MTTDDDAPESREIVEPAGVPTAPPAQPAWRSHDRLMAAVLACSVLALMVAGSWLWWDGSSRRAADDARRDSVQAATNSIVAILSYQPGTAKEKLNAARDRLTGDFLDAYTQLIQTTVIPAAEQQRISTDARVPAAASVSATADRAVVLAYVNQKSTVGSQPPSVTVSSVRVSMEKVDGRWLISAFTPI